ncbi:MAG: glutamate--tRNA ligase [Bdellovibrionaceae bacterium]|nr:glutamate--tRNA ligase [Pseudobdellovibrionaceae bacterium]
MSSETRLRFAPSPTGYLHVGGARTALYNYLYARKTGGKFILRIEDTDEARSTVESLKMVIEDLDWLGFKWDEGPDANTLADVGPYGPYRQSARQNIYKEIADGLIQSGKAYYCFMTDAEIEAQREAAMKAGTYAHVNSPYADWPLDKALAKIAEGGKAVVRFRTKELKKDYIFQDIVRGEVKFPSDMVGDFVLLRSGGMPVYNFCCVVDDHMMKITHVLRAEEHLSNTLRQMMIYEAMGWAQPHFGHLSLILDEDRKKLSKRKGATSCHEFKGEGYLPEALSNFVALLGWSHPDGKEVMSAQELVDSFSLDRFNPAGAVFDAVKLKWMNSVHLRALSNEKIWGEIAPFLKEAGLQLPADPAWQSRSVETFRPKLETMVDAVELYRPLADGSYAILPEADEVFTWPQSKAVFEAWIAGLKALPQEELSAEDFAKVQDEVKVKAAVKGKNLFMPIRVAVIGKPHGTELQILVPLMKKASLIARAEQCLAKMG